MLSPSGGDTAPDLDPEKDAETERVPEQPSMSQLVTTDEMEDEDPKLEDFIEEAVGADVEEERLSDEEERSKEEELSESESELEPEPEPEPEPEEKREEEPAKEKSKYEIEVLEIQPEEAEEVLEEEEVEEYEYTKEEIKFMKTAFVAYQKEKPSSKQGPAPKKGKEKEVKLTEIPINSLGSVLRSLGLNPTQAALKRYADWLDAHPTKGTVKFDELLIIVGREKKVIIDESNVLEAFRFIDIEKQKFIPIEMLYDLLANSSERLTPAEWIIFAHLADPKKTGFVDYEKFVALMGPNPPAPEKKPKGKGKKKGKGK